MGAGSKMDLESLFSGTLDCPSEDGSGSCSGLGYFSPHRLIFPTEENLRLVQLLAYYEETASMGLAVTTCREKQSSPLKAGATE